MFRIMLCNKLMYYIAVLCQLHSALMYHLHLLYVSYARVHYVHYVHISVLCTCFMLTICVDIICAHITFLTLTYDNSVFFTPQPELTERLNTLVYSVGLYEDVTLQQEVS